MVKNGKILFNVGFILIFSHSFTISTHLSIYNIHSQKWRDFWHTKIIENPFYVAKSKQKNGPTRLLCHICCIIMYLYRKNMIMILFFYFKRLFRHVAHQLNGALPSFANRGCCMRACPSLFLSTSLGLLKTFLFILFYYFHFMQLLHTN